MGAALGQGPERSAWVQNAYDTVVAVESLDSLGRVVSRGSGSFITPRGHVLTNYHVVADERGEPRRIANILLTRSATQAPRFAFVAEFVAGDARLDLALLRITSDAMGRPIPASQVFPFLAIVDHRSLKLDDEISIWGYPELAGGSISSTRGTISGYNNESRSSAGDRWILTDADMKPGNSGGAAITADGYLVGVPTVVTRSVPDGRPIVFTQNWMRPAIFVREIAPTLTGLRIVGQDAGGSCDAASVSALRECVARGGTVRLGAGTFNLDQPLVVRMGLTLEGTGPDSTRLVGSSAGGVVLVDGGALRLSKLSVAYAGASPADVISVRSGSLVVDAARVSGGVPSAPDAAVRLGSGVRILGRGTLHISDSTLENNGRHGLFVDGEGVVRVERVSAQRNARAGIAVGGWSAPVVLNSTLAYNGDSGLFFAERSAGEARGNRSEWNRLDGIAVGGQATPLIEQNTFQSNGRFGIYVDASAFPQIGVNRFTANAQGDRNR